MTTHAADTLKDGACAPNLVTAPVAAAMEEYRGSDGRWSARP